MAVATPVNYIFLYSRGINLPKSFQIIHHSHFQHFFDNLTFDILVFSIETQNQLNAQTAFLVNLAKQESYVLFPLTLTPWRFSTWG
jgi:hypothetical protein